MCIFHCRISASPSLSHSVDYSLTLCGHKISVFVACFLTSVPFSSNHCFCLDWDTRSLVPPFFLSFSRVMLISERMHFLQIITFFFLKTQKPRCLSWLSLSAISALTVTVSTSSPFTHRQGHLRKLSIIMQRGKLLITCSHPVFCFSADDTVLFSSLSGQDRKYAEYSDRM